MADDGKWDRRSALRAAAVLAGVAAAAPLLGESAMAQAGGDADALFRAGEFERAGRAYEEILKKNPSNLHAARRRGYVGLLGNKFPDAEKYLKMAITLAPDDQQANYFLADCYTRQDKLSLAAPHWQAADWGTYATQFAAISGEPYQIHGDIAQVPIQQLDPVPLVEASVNGGPTKKFSFYSHIDSLSVSQKVAEEAGLRVVTQELIEYQGKPMWLYYGILDSFKVGGIELRNIPVRWSDSEGNPDFGDGMIGIWIFHHFLTTVGYADRSLTLRRRTPETARKARADAERAGAERLPLWLARGLLSRGSVDGSGTRLMGLSVGGPGEMVAGLPEVTAEQLRIRIDHDRPVEAFAGGQPVVSYPCYPKEVRVGNATAKDTYCYANNRAPGGEFDVLGHVAHSFWKPYNTTLDFTDMTVHIVRGKAG
jgi:tetratricopeptide (TPR) repeat protein